MNIMIHAKPWMSIGEALHKMWNELMFANFHFTGATQNEETPDDTTNSQEE